MMLRKGMAFLLSAILLVGTAAAAVSPSHWAYDDVTWAQGRGIMTVSDVEPDVPITRGAFVESLWKAAGSPTIQGTTNFTDVPQTASYAAAVAWAVEEGITTGNTATTFAPKESLLREQAFTFLYRAMENFGKTPAEPGELMLFRDSGSVSSYAKDPIGSLYQMGIVGGDQNLKLNPKSNVTWAETAKLLRTVATYKGTTQPYSFFDDAIFIGDSVTLKLDLYTAKQRKTDPDFFGKAQFLTAGSLGSGNALWEVSSKSVHPSYRGKKQLIETSVAQSGAKKVFLMLGMNDVGVYGPEKSVQNLDTLIGRIKAAVPDAKIYVQSATPIFKGREKQVLNNAVLTEYNRQVKALCEKKGYTYLDVASVLADEGGYLRKEYCSDQQTMGIHFTDPACRVWIDYLRAHCT